MSTESIFSMILIWAFVGGGFAYFVRRAMQKEKTKKQAPQA
jgi:preprotein translocase subunit YajC